MYKIYFEPNGRTNTFDINKYIKVRTRPVIPQAEEIVNEIKLGDGTTMFDHTGIFKKRVIDLECNFVSKSKKEWLEHCAKIQDYFYGGKGKLRLPNEDELTYWIVDNIEVSMDSRWHGIGTTLEVSFTVDPFRYLIEYDKAESYTGEINYTLNFYNPYRDSYPVYRLYYNANVSGFSITNQTTTNVFSINNPFASLTPLYIDIDVENCVLKYVFSNSEEVHTELTSGDFNELIIPQGTSSFLVEGGASAEFEIYRRYRKL